MREDRGYELRVVSHIVLVVAVTIFSLILIGLDLYLGWDRWTIPLFITAMLVCPAIHIFNVSDEGFRLYVYSIVMFVEIFYYIMHTESLYDATPILMLTFTLLAMTQDRRLIIICIAVGVAGIMVRVIADYDAIVANARITDVIKLIWNSLLVIVTGLIVVRMLRISEESRIFYGELIRTLEQETKRADLFLANVSNEIKTPVDEIIGLADGALAAGKEDMIADRLSGISFEG
ncbi:MAG: hypothetical protein J5966_04060, partial [Lachnospiraceae bacterium]|nr:hypothetical protein [Lachnospiraceae bacterium]